MKRVLQGLGLLQLFLLVAIGVRIVRVWSTPLPEFGDIPDLPAASSIPPAKPAAKVSGAVTDGIVEHDLFDEQRGQNKDIVVDGAVSEEPPVPPPSTVKLVGVMRIGNSPVGILLDTTVKPDQQSVRKGDMFGEYEVGDILPSSLILLGGAGQQFQIPLRLEAGGGAAPAPGTPGVPPPRPGVAPGAVHPVTAPKPASARPVALPPNAAAANDPKTQTARERAQAIAQRNADMRKAGGHPGPGGEGGENQQGASAPDPVQARLEALRALRDAAKAR